MTAYAGLRLLVVGGGITGLAAAWEASIQGAEVLLVEASERFGGKLRTEHVDGLAIEAGPDSFVAYRPAALTLVRELGLGEEVVEVRGGRTVHLRTDGRLQPIPDGMGLVLPTKLGPFVRTPVLRWRHKARALLDLVLPRRLGASDVAIGDLLRARLGEGIVQRFADPMLGGIYGATVDELSLDAVLPILREHERTHRSLIIASLASGRAARAAAQSTSGSGGTTRGPSSPFRSLATGLGALPDRLVDALTERGADLRRHTRVDALTPEGEQTRVRLSDGTEHVVDGVVLAAGAAASADLVEPYAASAAAALRQVRHASTTVVTLAWPESAFATPPTTQGWLEAGDAPVSGVTISSAKWPGRAPAGVVLVRAFVPDRVGRLARGSDGEILDAVTRHVSGILGAHQPPTLTRVTRWVGVMPKYTVGHLDRVAAVDAGLAGQPSWTVAGSALRGVGIPDCIADGRAAVSRVLGSRKATAAASPTTATPTSTATPTTASPTITAPAAHAREDTRMSTQEQPTATETSAPAAAPAAGLAPATAPAAKVTAREINETIRYTCWAVFAAAEGPDSGTAERLVEVVAGLAATDVVVRGFYDVSAMRADADVMVWLHGPTPESIQTAVRAIRRQGFGPAATFVWSGVGMHRPAEFNKGHVPAFMTGAPAQDYLVVYPFVRSLEWYLLPEAERRAMLVEHGMMGRAWPQVLTNTVAAFALGDYEWMLALEGPALHDIVDLMRHLRAAEARRHVRVEVPFYTGRLVGIAEAVDALR